MHLESGWIQELLNWLTANPGWGWALVFLVAFLESLVLIGILLPGIMILFGVGALIGLDVMAMMPIWFAASAGALLGDGLSYALGRRFGEHLLDIWPFSRYPRMMERGREFFRQTRIKKRNRRKIHRTAEADNSGGCRNNGHDAWTLYRR